jgi:hypothetical protein
MDPVGVLVGIAAVIVFELVLRRRRGRQGPP